LDQSIGTNDPVEPLPYGLTGAGLKRVPPPNDQTHVSSFLAAQSSAMVGAGATLIWATGTPLSELGARPLATRTSYFSDLAGGGAEPPPHTISTFGSAGVCSLIAAARGTFG